MNDAAGFVMLMWLVSMVINVIALIWIVYLLFRVSYWKGKWKDRSHRNAPIAAKNYAEYHDQWRGQ